MMKNATQCVNSELSANRKLMMEEHLVPLLSQFFGYHALLYTPLAKSLCGDNLCIKHQFVIGQKANGSVGGEAEGEDNVLSLQCRFEELPIAADLVDLALLPNILQNSPNPHQVLREVERVLIPEGVVILIGRNPYSWQGLKTTFLRWRQKKIPIAPDISKRRISDWFGLLGFETEKQFNISLSNQQVQNSQAYPWVKKLAHYFCSCFCSYYIIIGSKKVSTLTPIRPSWRSNKHLVPPRVAEPSVRAQVENWFERVK